MKIINPEHYLLCTSSSIISEEISKFEMERGEDYDKSSDLIIPVFNVSKKLEQ